MALEMVLNELSLQPADSIYTARQRMNIFIATVRAATSHQASRSIRTKTEIRDITLAPDYPLNSWLYDTAVDLEARRYVMALAARVPFWDGLPELQDRLLEYDFRFQGQPAPGLGVAYLLDSLAISLLSDECWNAALLVLDAQWITGDGDIQNQSANVIHASLPEHVDEHRDWIQERLLSDVRDAADLWERRSELFPQLTFCEAVGPQVRSLSLTMLRPVARRLIELQGYCHHWTDGGFNPDELPTQATPESQSTLQQFGRERTFLCPDGQERTFSWKVHLTPHAWRLYFHPDPTTRTMIIGYVGPHMSTTKYKGN